MKSINCSDLKSESFITNIYDKNHIFHRTESFITKKDEERFFIQNVIPFPIAKVDNKGREVNTGGLSLEEVLDFIYTYEWHKRGIVGTKGDQVKYDFNKFAIILRLFGFTLSSSGDIIQINNYGEWRINPPVSQWLMNTMSYLYFYNNRTGSQNGVSVFKKLFDVRHFSKHYKKDDEYKHFIRLSNDDWMKHFTSYCEPGYFNQLKVERIDKNGIDFGYKLYETQFQYYTETDEDETEENVDLRNEVTQMVITHQKYNNGFITNKVIYDRLSVFFSGDVTKNQIYKLFDQIILSCGYIVEQKRTMKGRGRLIQQRKCVTMEKKEIGSLTVHEALGIQ